MRKDKSAITAKRILHELSLWAVTASISLGISSSIVISSIRTILTTPNIYTTVVYTTLVVFGGLWLWLSVTLLYHITKIYRKNSLGFLKGDIKNLPATVKDVISLYRGYHLYLILVNVLLLAVGTLFMILSVQEYVVAIIGLNEFAFRFSIGLFSALYAILCLYLLRITMFRRLSKVRSLEEEFVKFLGWGHETEKKHI